MITVEKICGAIGRNELSKRLGVGITAISNYCVANELPANCFDIVEAICIEKQIDCPRELFSFKKDKAA